MKHGRPVVTVDRENIVRRLAVLDALMSAATELIELLRFEMENPTQARSEAMFMLRLHFKMLSDIRDDLRHRISVN